MIDREVDALTNEMPTAEDAVAGMLLRHGFDMYAQGVLQYPERAPSIAERLRTREANAGPCVAAIEALARGDLRGAADHHDLLAAIERLTNERDEARAWVRRITAAERVLTCVYCGEAYPPGTPDHGAEVLTAHVRVCAKHPMREAEAEIARLRERDAAWRRATGCADPERVIDETGRLCSCEGAELPQIGDTVDTCWTCNGLVKEPDESEPVDAGCEP